MPQLFSRTDNLNWLTPSIADILEQGAPPPGGDGSIRRQMVAIQETLAEQETPVKVVNMRSTPSYTMFILQPEYVGRLTNRRLITKNEIKNNIGVLSEKFEEWEIGFQSTVSDDNALCGIILRTKEHSPNSLRRYLVRGGYRDYPSNFAFPIGLTLEPKLIIGNLTEIENLLVVGKGSVRNHLITSILLTQVLLNTPSELRIVLAGEHVSSYDKLAQVPHSVGKIIDKPNRIAKLLESLVKESKRRLNTFYESGVNTFDRYNTQQLSENKLPLPTITLIVDSLSDEQILPKVADLSGVLRDLLLNGSQVGIHVIVTVDEMEHLPEMLQDIFQYSVILRSVNPQLIEKATGYNKSLLRFIDAFYVEATEQRVTPLELCTVSTKELQATVDYWEQAKRIRERETEAKAVSGTTGLTDVLPNLGTGPLPPAPPVSIESNIEAEANLPFVDAEDTSYEQAVSLAAYLGWISVGALRDVLRYDDKKAQRIIERLREEGIIESGEGGIQRFVRLSDKPE